MQIAWIKKTTILDYPWLVACLIFTPWCNLRCHQCYNPEFVDPEKLKCTLKDLISEKSFFNFLKSRKQFLDWVVIWWWEPSLQSDIFEFIKKIKEMWFLVKLDTNWRDPKLIEKLINEKVVDYIAMDIKHTFDKYSSITWVNENTSKYIHSIEILKNSIIDYEFRTTVVKWYHTNEDIEEICKTIDWSRAYHIQNYIWTNILNKNFDWTAFSKKELEGFMKIIKNYTKISSIR